MGILSIPCCCIEKQMKILGGLKRTTHGGYVAVVKVCTDQGMSNCLKASQSRKACIRHTSWHVGTASPAIRLGWVSDF